MAAQTSMIHIRVDDTVKMQAAENLANYGLAVSDAVRFLLTCVAREGALSAGLTSDPTAYDAWFRAKVHEALADTSPTIPLEQIMDEAQALIYFLYVRHTPMYIMMDVRKTSGLAKHGREQGMMEEYTNKACAQPDIANLFF